MRPERLFEILAVAERLKCNTRHSWTSTGRRESVAEHSWRLALMALLVADEFPDVNCGRVVRMCLVHDLGEAFTGDIPAFEKRRQDETHEAALLARWVETLPEPLRAEWRSLYAEMEALATPEARLYKALDKLEAVIQHNEADIATWLPLEYDLNIAYGADEVAWNGYLRRLKEAANEISRQKIAAAKEQAPDDAGKEPRLSDGVRSAVHRSLQSLSKSCTFWQAFGLHECASEPFRTFSLAFPASSGFTTFWHQKVVPKASARRNRRGPTVVCA